MGAAPGKNFGPYGAGSYGPARPGNMTYGAQQSYAGGSAGTSGGPLGMTDNPNMVWDEARGGYWVKETTVERNNNVYGGAGSASQTYSNAYPNTSSSGGGKIIRTTTTSCDDCHGCDDCHDHDTYYMKKVVKKIDDRDEYNITLPPPVMMMPPQPPPQVFLINQSEPEKKQPCGPTTFFPLVQPSRYSLETQQKSSCPQHSCCSTGSCGSGGCGGGCGGGGMRGIACVRCGSYHR